MFVWVSKLEPALLERLIKRLKKVEAPRSQARGFDKSGGVLLSHSASAAVPLALKGLTTEFGMGSGMTLSTSPPKQMESNSSGS